MTEKKKTKLSFEEIYAAYKKIIYMETCRKLASKELIEESMQETLIKIHQQYEKIANMDVAAQAVYIGKIARGTAINIFYSEVAKRNNIVYIEDYEEDGIELAKEDTLIIPDIIVELDLHDYLEQLSAQDREIIHLVYYEEYTYSEIAVMLSISEENARQKLCRAKKHLKSIMEKSGLRGV